MLFLFLCGGQGKRFDMVTPCRKPTMLIYGRPMYKWVLDSVIDSINALHVVVQDDSIGKSMLFNIQKNYDLPITSTKLTYYTRGPAETCALCKLSEPFWVLDNDIIYDKSIDWTLDDNTVGIVVQKEDIEGDVTPYSHVLIEDGYVTKIIEKKKISNYIVLGAYGFGSPNLYDKIFEYFLKSDFKKNEWFMSSIIQCAIELGIKVKPIFSHKSVSIGTPEQLQEAICQKIIEPRPLRWVFDLDETLVTLPSKPNDYSTVLPIPKTIDFLNSLYEQGHYIIIHTARHMKSCHNDIAKVKECMEEVTKNTLKNFNICYHELIFGKPYADVYVDDKSTNPLHWQENWLSASLGFGWEIYDNFSKKIINLNHNVCCKIATKQEGYGNGYFIDYCPKELLEHIPKLYDIEDISETHVKILMQWKSDAITLNKFYIHDMLDESIFINTLDLLKKIHGMKYTGDKHEIMMNYFPKFKTRFDTYEIYQKLNINLTLLQEFFDTYDPTIVSCVHGDYWFGNLLWAHKEQKLYIIDMRGRLGDTYAIYGDAYYDYAKLIQSIYGFDQLVETGYYHIPPKRDEFLKIFYNYFDFSEEQQIIIKKISAVLILGSIPFHDTLVNIDEIKKLVKLLWSEII